MPIHPITLTQAVNNTLSRTSALIDLYGPRLAGSKSCELAAEDICFEIYTARHLQFLVSDLNGSLSLSKELSVECQELAKSAGVPSELTRMVFGGGATDAAELARAGILATTMLAMPTDLVRDGLVYHTGADTVDAIEPDAVRACLEVACRLVEELDQAV